MGIILVLVAACAYNQTVATNNAIRSCGSAGVASLNTTCGVSNYSVAFTCNQQRPPTPIPPPYPAGPDDTGPYLDGVWEDDDTGGGGGGCPPDQMGCNPSVQGVPGQGWLGA